MANLQGFDANQVEPATDMSVIPAGKYAALIVASEMKPTKAGTGEYLELTFQIIEGEFQNRQVWSRLNLINPNSTAVGIAQRDLSSICRAVGVMTPTDSSQLHNIPLTILVKVTKRSDNGEPSNEIGGYYKRNKPEAKFGAQPTQQPASGSSAAQWASAVG